MSDIWPAEHDLSPAPSDTTLFSSPACQSDYTTKGARRQRLCRNRIPARLRPKARAWSRLPATSTHASCLLQAKKRLRRPSLPQPDSSNSKAAPQIAIVKTESCTPPIPPPFYPAYSNSVMRFDREILQWEVVVAPSTRPVLGFGAYAKEGPPLNLFHRYCRSSSAHFEIHYSVKTSPSQNGQALRSKTPRSSSHPDRRQPIPFGGSPCGLRHGPGGYSAAAGAVYPGRRAAPLPLIFGKPFAYIRFGRTDQTKAELYSHGELSLVER